MKKYFYGLLLIVFASCSADTPPVQPFLLKRPAAYVVGSDNTLTVLNLANHQVDTTIFLPSNGKNFSHHINLSPNQTEFVVAQPSFNFFEHHGTLHQLATTGGLCVVDANTGKVKRQWPVASANYNGIFLAQNQEVWTALVSHDGRVQVFEATSGKLLHTIQVDADPTSVVAVGNHVFVACEESSFVTVIDTTTKTVTKKIKVDLFPSSVSASGDWVVVLNKNQPSINFINPITLQAEWAIDLSFKPSLAVYHPKLTEWWVGSDDKPEIHRYALEQGSWKLNGIIQLPSSAHALQFFDANQKALVVMDKVNQVVELSTTDFKILKTYSVGKQPNGVVILE